MNRYNRHIILSEVGVEGQKKLSSAKVLVVGAGGLGCPALQYLVAAGIGSIGIIDHDVVEESNLQRQVLFGSSSLGRNKALAAAERLSDLNPTISIRAYPFKLAAKNALELFKEYDLVVDGTDNFQIRYLINDAAVILNKPVVFGAIYKYEGQVSVFNYQNGPNYRCMFPVPPRAGSVANCSEVGVLGVLPGIIGSMQANEVLKIILGFKGVLSGKILCYNCQSGETTFIKLPRNESEYLRILSEKDQFEWQHRETTETCDISEISLDEALQLQDIQFIDVREPDELPRITLDNCYQIPLKYLEERLSEIDFKKRTVVFCQSGKRSKTAAAVLNRYMPGRCYSLIDSALALGERLKSTIK
jgi:adenylyltransferase/sulfurtransferase